MDQDSVGRLCPVIALNMSGILEEEEDIPVRTKTIAVDEMDLDEAIMQMELSNHDFYIYTDDETDRVSVVYRRNNGGYGLIETE